MDKQDCIVYTGQCFTIEWYYDSTGYSQAFEFFKSTSQAQKRKFFVLVKRIAEFGKIMDITKFRNEGNEIYAFKPQPDRYLCFFMKGKKIIITNGFSKRTDKLPKKEKEKSIKAMEDYKQGR
ncbi:MAG: type II toxin-antitoxin system RelE/ParE family toxin [Spirochaetia bacterium]|nr:type II toxin-antitoxin system RelE/ParE family toxin [Spirochaetia bacterium]